MTQGKLLVAEGVDASGKTTQVQYMAEYLRSKGFSVLSVREPGGTEVGEKIRDILLNVEMDPMTELMLFISSRMEIITKVIQPAIMKGQIVVCDRFIDSTYAYQGLGRGLTHSVIYLEKLITEYIKPDHVLYFDVSLEEAARRLKNRPVAQNRLDKETPEFKARVRQGFTERMVQHPERFVRIDASGPIVDVNYLVRKWLDDQFIPTVKQLQKERNI